ncbi:MAG: FAD-dependent thymidylate synthase [Cetobacterium sp.]
MSELKVKLIAHTPNPDKVVAMAAKLCYSPVGVEEIEKNLSDEQISKFVNMLVNIGHESPLEHCTFTFAVEGLNRSTSHQVVRHRISSFSQQSQRYVNLAETFDYVTPTIINCMDEYNETDEFTKDFDNDMKTIHEMYKKWQVKIKGFVEDTNYPTYGMSPEKVANENAREVLPNACETKMVFTMNGRSLLNFLSHRDCNRAQDLIRQLAREMTKQLQEVAPVLFKTVGASCRYGKCHEGNMSCKSPLPKWN